MRPELLDEARRLSVNDRIELVEAIWNSVSEDAALEQLSLSDLHRAELDRRLADWEENPGSGGSWAEVHERLKQGK
jgi:putative addiction module component (TIGR02574 family)